MVPPTLAIQTELPEITESVFAPNKALLTAIEESSKWLEYLIISDFPDDTPKSYPPPPGVHLISNIKCRSVPT